MRQKEQPFGNVLGLKTLAHRRQNATTLEIALRSSLMYEGRAVGALCATRAQASRQALRREQDLLLRFAGQPKGPSKKCEKILRAAVVPQELPQPADTSPRERRAHELAYVPQLAGVFGVRWRQDNSSPIARWSEREHGLSRVNVCHGFRRPLESEVSSSSIHGRRFWSRFFLVLE